MDPGGLLSALAASARAGAEAILQAANAQAEAIARDGERRRAALRARAKAEADAAFAAALDDEVRSARREAAREALQARQRFLDEVHRRASALLPAAVESAEYRRGLGGRLAEALGYASSDASVRCAPVLLVPLRELAQGRAPVEADEAIRDGFEIVAQGGSLRVVARLSAELERRWPLFAVQLARKAGR